MKILGSDITIYGADEQGKAVVPFTAASKISYELMRRHDITLSFVSDTYIAILKGDYVDHDNIRYTVMADYVPDGEVGRYKYEVEFHAPEILFQNLPFFYVNAGVIEAEWSLTANPSVFIDAVIACIAQHTGETWVKGTITQVDPISLSFSEVSVFDALTAIAEACETEWYVRGTTIYLTRCEEGVAATLTEGLSVKTITPKDTKEDFCNRVFAFGSTRNLSRAYRNADTSTAELRRRLKMPLGVPYVDSAALQAITDPSAGQIVARVKIFEEVYPKIVCAIASAYSVQSTDQEGTAYTIFSIKQNEIVWDDDYLTTDPLSVHFEDGALAGRDFEVFATKDPSFIRLPRGKSEECRLIAGDLETLPAESLLSNVNRWKVLAQEWLSLLTGVDSADSVFTEAVSRHTSAIAACNTYLASQTAPNLAALVTASNAWTTAANAWYGDESTNYWFEILPKSETIYIPNTVLRPQIGDEFVLYNYDISLVDDQLVPAAELQLQAVAQAWVDELDKDTNAYNVQTMAAYCQTHSLIFDFGQRINIVSDRFAGGSRLSRIIGYERTLANPHDCQYIIGDASRYNRIGALESKVDEIEYQQYIKERSTGQMPRILRTIDNITPSETNVLSSVRSLETFVKRSATGATIEGNGKTFGIDVDADGNLVFHGNIYATGSVSAQGVGTGGGTGGGGTSYNRLDTWDAYIPGTTDTWVLSALLGHDLHTRVSALEEDTPNVAWGVPTTDYVPLTVNAISRQLSIHGHGHTFDSLASKPTTIAGYGITDSLIYEGDARLTNSRPASDVYSWAKAATKPTYSYTEVGAAAASHVHAAATTSVAGFMSTTDKSKLDGIEEQANKYVHPTKTARNVGGGAHFITAFTSDTLGHVTGITTSAMTKADVEAVLTGNSITSHYHDDRYFQKGDLFTKEGSGTEADPYRIRANFPFYGVSSVAALGIGSGGGGAAYDRLDVWADYTADKAGWVLSALLGVNLDTRVQTLEASTPNVAYGVPTTQYVALTVNSTTRSLSVDGHTHTKAGITDFAHTHGNVTNDGKIGSTASLVIVTGTAGALTAKAAGTTSQYLRGDGSWATPPDTVYTHPNSGVSAGTYKSVTVNVLGHVTAGSNPTTLEGYGITDAMSTSHAANAITATNISNWGTAYTNNHTHANKSLLDAFSQGDANVLSHLFIDANGKLYTDVDFYSQGTVAALGVGSGGGGTFYDRLDTWASYDSGKAGWVLSAALGYDIHGRVSTLEASTPNVGWGVMGSGYIPLTVNGASYQLSTHGHTHTKSSITDFAHTHDDRYYTETEVDTLLANKANWDTAYGWGNHASAGYAANSALTSHTGNTNNPHAVTKTQVGLGNVANVAALPLAGGTVTGSINRALTTRNLGGPLVAWRNSAAYGTVDLGGWAADSMAYYGTDDSRLCGIGVYGTVDVVNYMYLGLGTYGAANQVRIYSDRVTWGGGNIFHAGNANLSSVNWSAKNLVLAGSITGVTTIAASSTISATTAILSNLTAGYVPYHTAGGLVNGPIFTDGTKVGIGVTAPKEKLEIRGNVYITNNEQVPIGNSAGSLIFGFTGNSASNYPIASIEGIQSGCGVNVIDGNDQYGHLIFKTSGSNSAPSEKMRITDIGHIGIGYSSGTEISNYKLAVNGSGYYNGNLSLSSADGTYLQIGGGRLIWDNTNNAIKVIKSDGTAANFYATGSNTAFGIGSGGGGSSYNMVSDWSQYVAGSELWVVSAELINSLRTSVTSHIGDSTHASAGEKSNWNAAYSHSLVTGGVHMTTTDRSQLTTAYNHSQAAHQTIINGTGFVKAEGTTLSYDSNTYLTSITKAQVEAVLTGGITTHTHAYLSTGGGNLTGDLVFESIANTDRFIRFSYTSANDTFSWRIGYLGTGTGDANYLAFQTAGSAGTTWTSALQLGLDTKDATFFGKIIKSGGTSGQFLKADGSVDSTSYALLTGSSAQDFATKNLAVAGTSITTGLSAMGLATPYAYAHVRGGIITENPSYGVGNAGGATTRNRAGIVISSNHATNNSVFWISTDAAVGNALNIGIGNTFDDTNKRLSLSHNGLLTASNFATANADGAYIQVGPIKILYDATYGAIRVEGNIYATGSNTAFGVGGGAGGGGLITNVYGTSGFGGTYSDVDLSSTFNAYAINSLYTALQGKAASNHTHAAASALVAGFVTTGSQSFKGVKGFLDGFDCTAAANFRTSLRVLNNAENDWVTFAERYVCSPESEAVVNLMNIGAIYSAYQGENITSYDEENMKVTHHWDNVYEQNVIVKGYVDAAKVAPGIALARANKFATMGEKLNYQPGMIRSGQIPRKVVVIGNSMTAHAYNETLGWTVSDFREMAASKPDTGWITLIKKHLVTLNPDVKVYKSNGAAWEAQTLGSKAYSTIQGNAVWEATETGPATTAYTLDSILDSDVDVVIVQLYENVPDTTGNAANCATLSADYQNLYASIRAKCPNARLYQFCGFWQTEGKGTAVMTACARANVEPIHAPVIMWPRTGASQYPDNFKCVAGDIIRDADNNQLCTVSASVAGHPNDLGFGVMAAYTIFKLYNSGGVLNDYLTRFILKVNAPNGVTDWMDATTDVTGDLYYDASVSTLAAFQSAYAPYLKYMVLGGKYSATVKAPTNSAGTTWAAAHCFLEIKHSGIVGNNYKPTIQRIVSVMMQPSTALKGRLSYHQTQSLTAISILFNNPLTNTHYYEKRRNDRIPKCLASIDERRRLQQVPTQVMLCCFTYTRPYGE